jgi:hypothetical protein
MTEKKEKIQPLLDAQGKPVDFGVEPYDDGTTFTDPILLPGDVNTMDPQTANDWAEAQAPLYEDYYQDPNAPQNPLPPPIIPASMKKEKEDEPKS